MPRFLTLADVAELLQISAAACYQLVHSGELPAFQIGGRGQWRIEEAKFNQFIEDRHAAARAMLSSEKSAGKTSLPIVDTAPAPTTAK